MAKVVEEDGSVNIGRPIAPKPPATEYSPRLEVTDWRRTFVILPKKATSGTDIKPLTFAYTRSREAFSNGQRLLFIDWLTEHEYLMQLLKAE